MSNNDYNKVTSSSVSVGNWMWTILLSHIPLVNLILYLVTALHSKKPSKRNWAIGNALLDVLAKIIAGVLAVILCVVLSGNVVKYFETTPLSDFSVPDFIIYIAEQYDEEKQPADDDIPDIGESTDTESMTSEDDFFGSDLDAEDDGLTEDDGIIKDDDIIEDIEETVVGDIIDDNENTEEADPENVG